MADFEAVRGSVDLVDYCVARGLARRGRDTFVCPACGSGNGPRHTAAFHIKGDRWHCFSCGRGGDVFDLAGILDGTDDRLAQLRSVAEWAGGAGTGGHGPGRVGAGAAEPSAGQGSGRAREEAYLRSMQANIHDPEAEAYVRDRGFTMDEAVAWGLGYDPGRRRLVLPWAGSVYYHVDRSTAGGHPKYTKPRTADVGCQPLYNPAALDSAAFFVVEGVLDALAVSACGFEAVALGGTGCRAAVDAMAAHGTRGTAIVMLDSDAPGRRAAVELQAMLDRAGIATRVAKTVSKDAAEWLQADRAALGAFLRAEYEKAVASGYDDAMARLSVLNPADVTASIADLSDASRPTPTGIGGLDEVLGGGLRTGLYVLGAMSSMGKTTLCVQVADYVAVSGRPVLFVTIEQGVDEIAAKSLSRIMSGSGRQYSTLDVTSLTARRHWDADDRRRLAEAREAYDHWVAPNLRIMAGATQPTVADVRCAAEALAAHYGQPPVVFLDYLQLLAPSLGKDSDKQAMDRNVVALRQMARDLRTTVFAVSSLNRGSYSAGVSLDSFKESGSIEYGADVLLGLQPRGLREHLDSVRDARTRREAERFVRKSKDAEVRACELVVLKNRVGRTPDEGIPLMFWPAASLFEEGMPVPSSDAKQETCLL